MKKTDKSSKQTINQLLSVFGSFQAKSKRYDIHTSQNTF